MTGKLPRCKAIKMKCTNKVLFCLKRYSSGPLPSISDPSHILSFTELDAV